MQGQIRSKILHRIVKELAVSPWCGKAWECYYCYLLDRRYPCPPRLPHTRQLPESPLDPCGSDSGTHIIISRNPYVVVFGR